MSLNYKPSYCVNCNKGQNGTLSLYQQILLLVLFLLGIIPGIVYFFVGTPSLCRSCGLKIYDRTRFTEKQSDRIKSLLGKEIEDSIKNTSEFKLPKNNKVKNVLKDPNTKKINIIKYSQKAGIISSEQAEEMIKELCVDTK